ncbi:MAG: GTPase ObgE [Candidatus Ryanbacteria bacterium]|nr:GTPase ObgE [Candidatus Ryanbacteria bacterium]
MLVDDVTIKVRAGKGGKGSVAFNKNMMSLGPVGGSGGHGGDVIFEGVSDLSMLNQFRYKKELSAEDGLFGRDQFRDGHNGEDMILKVPVGTVIHNLTKKTNHELTHIDEQFIVAKGGFGGKGNFHFRSSRNTTPKQSQPGLPGEEAVLRLELKLIADIGFVGFPNVGKSSLLNELTRAQSRVANYPFTTLEPHLGVWYDLILADIPGLIEGASEGKGLGIKFLRHVERTRVLFHFISAESDDPANDYTVIRKELGKHSKELLEKTEYLFVSKSDTKSDKELKKILTVLKKKNKTASLLSIHDSDAIKRVEKILQKITKEKHKAA